MAVTDACAPMEYMHLEIATRNAMNFFMLVIRRMITILGHASVVYFDNKQIYMVPTLC